MDDIIPLGFLASGSRFRRIYERLQVSGDKVYDNLGLDFKSSWFPVYYTLAHADRPLTIMAITEQIAFSHITVKNIVKELENDGLVEITPNAHDKRSKLVKLTRKGKHLLKRLQPLWHKMSAALEEILTAGHPGMLEILGRIEQALSDKPLHERIK